MKKPATKTTKSSSRGTSGDSSSSNVATRKPAPEIQSNVDRSSQIISPLKIVPREFSATRIQDIIHLSSDIIITLAMNQNVQTINKAGCKSLGYLEKEILGKNWSDHFVTPSMRVSALQSLKKLFDGDEDSTGYLVIPIINKKGEERLVEWQALALKNEEDGSAEGILLSGRDITAQKRVEKELIQSEWDMALAQKIARLGSWVYNMGTNEIRMSHEMCRIFGIPAQALTITYKNFIKLIHPEDRPLVEKSHKESLRTGKGHRIEYRVPLPDKTERTIYEESKVFLDDLDNPLKVRGIAQDITERKKVEEALRHSEQELSIAQKIGKMGNWVYDFEKDELWWSDEVYRIFGLRPKEFKPSYQAILNTVHPEDRDFVDSTYQNTIKEKKSYSMDHRIVWPDGPIRTVHQECEIFFNEQGNPQKLRGIVQDITERKEAEVKLKTYQEQLLHAEKLSSLGKLSASIAHEINNPLFGIRNVLERTKMVIPMEEADTRFIDMAISETDRIAKLTRRLNDFFGPSSRENKQPVQINDVLEEIVLWIQQGLKERNITLHIAYCEAPPEIMAVPDQIKQVALNLVQNAMEAIPKTGGEIELTTHHQDSHLLITIKDNGAGMDEETQKEIFEPFFTTKSDEDGTGLGLWVTEGIIQSHGGEIKVDSQIGKGSTFTVSFPTL